MPASFYLYLPKLRGHSLKKVNEPIVRHFHKNHKIKFWQFNAIRAKENKLFLRALDFFSCIWIVYCVILRAKLTSLADEYRHRDRSLKESSSRYDSDLTSVKSQLSRKVAEVKKSEEELRKRQVWDSTCYLKTKIVNVRQKCLIEFNFSLKFLQLERKWQLLKFKNSRHF